MGFFLELATDPMALARDLLRHVQRMPRLSRLLNGTVPCGSLDSCEILKSKAKNILNLWLLIIK